MSSDRPAFFRATKSVVSRLKFTADERILSMMTSDVVLYNHPVIREAATVGRKDERLGEVVVAFVVIKPGAQLDEEEFFASARTAW
jgi:acyl-coenzyme A synthetase/AMP-(fatty) acid ligase